MFDPYIQNPVLQISIFFIIKSSIARAIDQSLFENHHSKYFKPQSTRTTVTVFYTYRGPSNENHYTFSIQQY